MCYQQNSIYWALYFYHNKVKLPRKDTKSNFLIVANDTLRISKLISRTVTIALWNDRYVNISTNET